MTGSPSGTARHRNGTGGIPKKQRGATHEILRTKFPIPLEGILDELRRTGSWDGELTHLTRDGEKMIVANRWDLPMDASGAPHEILEINNNITNQKEAEERLHHAFQELKASEGRYRFLFIGGDMPRGQEMSCGQRRGIAHDFNNLLSVILGNVSLARMAGKLNERSENLLQQAGEACLRASELSGDRRLSQVDTRMIRS